jgi:hypothetical protein
MAFNVLVLSSFVGLPAFAKEQCFDTVSELEAIKVKTTWVETTENDGKPLTISVSDGSKGLVYSATKAGKVWLAGNVTVCRSGNELVFTMEHTTATDEVPMLARMMLPATQSAQIIDGKIMLGGGAWSGTFVSE